MFLTSNYYFQLKYETYIHIFAFEKAVSSESGEKSAR